MGAETDNFLIPRYEHQPATGQVDSFGGRAALQGAVAIPAEIDPTPASDPSEIVNTIPDQAGDTTEAISPYGDHGNRLPHRRRDDYGAQDLIAGDPELQIILGRMPRSMRPAYIAAIRRTLQANRNRYRWS
ncbi:MAG TPA: hypothetical protein VLG11_05535 [Candidatus Saccharimonadales bacterium]|nr:hypothetical protein [Candidatus Saccharimonadales bacterium]